MPTPIPGRAQREEISRRPMAVYNRNPSKIPEEE
jgi:hypothetical protein